MPFYSSSEKHCQWDTRVEKIAFETQNTANYSVTISWMPLTGSKGGNRSAASAIPYAFLVPEDNSGHVCCHGLRFLPEEQSSLQMLQYFFHPNSVRNIWCCIHLSWWIMLSWLQTPPCRRAYNDPMVVHIPPFPSASFVLRAGVVPGTVWRQQAVWHWVSLCSALRCSSLFTEFTI